MRGLPDWMEEWRLWGYAIGSSARYKPKWYEARAYVMGLRDAARIAESRRFPAEDIDEDADPNELRARRSMGREIIEAVHRHALSLFGL